MTTRTKMRFAELPADCVLLDVRTPDLDGFVVCERLRLLPGGAEMPVLFLTALRDIETFDRAARVDVFCLRFPDGE